MKIIIGNYLCKSTPRIRQKMLATIIYFSYYKSNFFKNGPFLLLYFCRSNTVDSEQMFKFADDWIRTSDLWYRKRLLYQLSHNLCPKKPKFVAFQFEPALTRQSCLTRLDEEGKEKKRKWFFIKKGFGPKWHQWFLSISRERKDGGGMAEWRNWIGLPIKKKRGERKIKFCDKLSGISPRRKF